MKTITVGQLLDMTLEPARRSLRRFKANIALRAAYRDLDVVTRQIKNSHAAQAWLHKRISRLESELRSYK